MSNNSPLRRKDLYAGRDALTGAALCVAVALALSLPIPLTVTAGILGTVVGQFFARWWFRRKPSAKLEEPTKPNSMFGFTVWVMCCKARWRPKAQ